MKSIKVFPKSKDEFDAALSWLSSYGKDRRRLTLEDDDEISFAFLFNPKADTDVITPKSGKSIK